MLFLSAVFCFCTSTSKTYNPISPLYNPQSKNIGKYRKRYFLPGNHKKENFHTCQYISYNLQSSEIVYILYHLKAPPLFLPSPDITVINKACSFF